MALVYLAYQFEEDQLTGDRLTKIMDDWFDFINCKNGSSFKHWYRYAKSQLDIFQN